MPGLRRGDLESVESYIATGGDLERMDWDNCTALHIACAGAFSQVAQLVSTFVHLFFFFFGGCVCVFWAYRFCFVPFVFRGDFVIAFLFVCVFFFLFLCLLIMFFV